MEGIFFVKMSNNEQSSGELVMFPFDRIVLAGTRRYSRLAKVTDILGGAVLSHQSGVEISQPAWSVRLISWINNKFQPATDDILEKPVDFENARTMLLIKKLAKNTKAD